jgi:hypothetical protein
MACAGQGKREDGQWERDIKAVGKGINTESGEVINNEQQRAIDKRSKHEGKRARGQRARNNESKRKARPEGQYRGKISLREQECKGLGGKSQAMNHKLESARAN